jgi:hypothetical protein
METSLFMMLVYVNFQKTIWNSDLMTACKFKYLMHIDEYTFSKIKKYFSATCMQ